MFSPEEIEAFFQMQQSVPEKIDLELSVEKASELRTELQSLLEHEGYKQLVVALRKQLFNRIAANIQRPSGLDGTVSLLYCNGEIAGIKLALDFVNILLDNCNESIKVSNRLLTDNYPDEQEQDNGQE